MSWVERTQNRNNGGIDEHLLDTEAVIFMRGKNSFGDPIWSYLKLTVRNFGEMKKRIDAGEQFHPGEYGEVMYAGQGEPTDEIREYMQQEYNLVDLEMPEPKEEPPIPQPLASLWGDEEDEESSRDYS